MKVLLTGSTGFIGRHLKTRLESEGHAVTPFFRQTGWLNFAPQEVIINAAAELDDVGKMYWPNTGLVYQLLERARIDGSRFIQIGSSSETGPVEGIRPENLFCSPSNFYEATKLAATNLCIGYANQFHMNVCVARAFTIYGNEDKPRKMLPTLWRAYCENKPFNCYPGGHDWTHVNDFVDAMIKILLSPEATKGQIFHVGTGISTSNADIVRLFEQSVGSQLNVVHHNSRYRTYDVLDWRAASTNMKRKIGWDSTITVAEGIKEFVMQEYFRQEKEPGL